MLPESFIEKFIKLVRANCVSRLGSEVIRNQKLEPVYLETTFFNMVDMFDRNISVRLACSRSHFIYNFCRYDAT